MKNLIIVILCFLTGTQFSISQKDFGVWSSLDVKVPLTKNWTAGIGLNARFKSNASEVSKTFVSPNISYKVFNFMKLSADYRFTNYPESGFFGNYNTHRVTLDADFKLIKYQKAISDTNLKETRKFEVSTRLRYSHENESGDLNDDYLRAQLKVEYTFPKSIGFSVYASGELFYHFKDEIRYTASGVETYNRFNKARIRAGFEYDFFKRHSLELFGMLYPKLESERIDFILGIGYTYELRRLNKKRK